MEPNKTQRVKAPWWCGVDHYYRRPPPTDEDSISDKQLENRVNFGEASISTRGEIGTEDGIPLSAKKVQEQLTQPEKVKPAPGPQEIVDQEIENLKRRLESIKLK